MNGDLRCLNFKLLQDTFLFIYRGSTVGNTVVDSISCSSSIFSMKNSSSSGANWCLFSLFGCRIDLHWTESEKNSGKIAKRIVLDLTFDDRTSEIAIMKELFSDHGKIQF